MSKERGSKLQAVKDTLEIVVLFATLWSQLEPLLR